MRPTPRTVRLALLMLLLSVAAVFGSVFLWIWQLLVALGVCVLLVDGLRVKLASGPQLTRRVDASLPLGVWCKVFLSVENPTGRPMSLTVHDHNPDGILARQQPFQLDVPANTTAEQYYEIRAVERGSFVFGKAHVLLNSPWGLWLSLTRPGEETKVRVYPNFQAVARYMKLDVSQRLSQIGIHRRRRRGEGREFHQMREFVEGDSMRQIDWKATSRMRKVITREFHDERDQQMLFLLDCGQSMRAQDGELSHFDHALNAVLLMASVGLRHGDAVGLMTFGGERRMLAPRKGTAQLNLILNNVFDIQPGLETADFTTLAQQVLTHCRKRSLIVLVTNIKDEDDGELAPALSMLRRKHLVLLASMRERVLDDVLEMPVVSFDDAVATSSVHTYLKSRRKIMQAMQTKGVICLDVLPEQLPVSMVNNYLSIKGQGLL